MSTELLPGKGARALTMEIDHRPVSFPEGASVLRAAELGGIKTEPELVYPKKKWGGLVDVFLESVVDSLNRIADRTRLIQFAPTVQ